MLLMEVSKRWNIVEFLKISIKIKIFKTFYEAETAICLKEMQLQMHFCPFSELFP